MGEANDGMIADAGDAFQRHVAVALQHGPLDVLIEQARAEEAPDGGLVGVERNGSAVGNGGIA